MATLRGKMTFTLTEHLCAGTGSIIHKCVSEKGESCIAKVFPKTDLGRTLFLREIAILKQIHSSFVIGLIDYSEANDSYAIITKNGGTNLYNYITNNDSIPEDAVRKMAQSMFRSIRHIHGKRIIHGDVKLENFVISDDGRVRLIDFGLSEQLPEGHMSTNVQCGSTFYRSPELIASAAHDMKTDVWSLGISLFALAARAFPFTTQDEFLNVCEVLMEAPAMELLENLHCSKELIDLIRSMLEKDPKRRPTIAECLDSPWFKPRK
jgi:serine/threonine protein kinase